MAASYARRHRRDDPSSTFSRPWLAHADYSCANMKFALLGSWSMRTDDDHVLERESYWKEVLHARSLSHNKN
ncbi:MAG TPA: hypothetical protein VFJ14_09370 [Nocardioidaceae bacterium]|nr:hypothetical protein [Nocardioidaceae bacterium]